ncbi:esterase [Buttiauxella izardii]|uniref:Esterase n=1 Tax=Buttiauxella izardii TaxID=82991 RepID=A0A3A5JKG3_9ENTR|nr:esterase [Buttiauxella izardii]RJT18773.1 esterase [Buttiauxella izardii]
MIEIYTEELAGIEVLHAVPTGKKESQLPVVYFYHGFTSSKLVYSYFAVALAQSGMRVIMPDAKQHGARFDGDETARLYQFWSILKSNIDEFSQLHQALAERYPVDEQRVAVGGASMGGMTALGIMARYSQVRCVACLMGSGYFISLGKNLFPPQALDLESLNELANYDISHQLEKIGNRPLLLWHGEQDDVVPAAETWRLEQALIEKGLDKQMTCLREPGVKHRITPTALEAARRFFSENL